MRQLERSYPAVNTRETQGMAVRHPEMAMEEVTPALITLSNRAFKRMQ